MVKRCRSGYNKLSVLGTILGVLTNNMSNVDYIVNLCTEISSQGKTPSVALIKNMSPRALAIPEVVKGLQYWKNNSNIRPTTANAPIDTTASSEQSLSQRVAKLEEQVATLTQQLANLVDKN